MTKINRKIIFFAIGSISFALLVASGFNALIARPNKIQIDLMGRSIAGPPDLRSYSPLPLFVSEGRERWVYKISPEEKLQLAGKCINRIFDICDLKTNKDAKYSTIYSVRMKENYLIIEAWYF